MTIPDRIAAWLPTARWFAAKGEAIAAVTVADEAELPGGITLAIVEVATAQGEKSRYVVPVDQEGRDAALTPAFAGWLVDAALGGGTTTAARGSFEGHATQASTPRGLAPPTVTPLGGDASNTSMLVQAAGAAYAVKLLRRCRDGIQPEVEIGEFLCRDAPWDGTPRLRGWLEHRASGAATAIATVVLVFFALAGGKLLALLGISFAAFRIAGGLLLFYTAFQMVYSQREPRDASDAERAVKIGRAYV